MEGERPSVGTFSPLIREEVRRTREKEEKQEQNDGDGVKTQSCDVS